MPPEEEKLEKIKADIGRARKWARKHFNVEQKEDHLLAPSTFDMEFPSPDEMAVWPRFYGRRLEPGFRYKLCWKGDGHLVWKGQNPLTGAPIEMRVT